MTIDDICMSFPLSSLHYSSSFLLYSGSLYRPTSRCNYSAGRHDRPALHNKHPFLYRENPIVYTNTRTLSISLVSVLSIVNLQGLALKIPSLVHNYCFLVFVYVRYFRHFSGHSSFDSIPLSASGNGVATCSYMETDGKDGRQRRGITQVAYINSVCALIQCTVSYLETMAYLPFETSQSALCNM